MAASDATHRVQHTGLVTQQKRLRHLSSLSARNIVSDEGNRDRESLMETYFTLHTWPSRETVYTSEKIHNSLNPTWRSFDLQMSCPNLDTSQSTILVRLWGGQTSDYSLVLEWLVDLRGLCYLGSQIHKDGVRYQPNSLIFGMFRGFYGAPDNVSDPSSIQNEFRTTLEVEQSAAILSYKIFSLGRLHTTQRAIRQTEASVSKVRSSIVEKLTLVKKRTALCSEREALKLRLSVLKYELEKQESLLATDCKKCTKSREGIDARVQDLKERKGRFLMEVDELKNQNQLYQERKDQLQKLAAKYTGRKTTLLGELSDIYPVVELPNHEHTILGIKLPNAERYSGTDDMVVSTGLGHTCHLILMMSQILKLPLRYPMIHYGSRSLVRDHITESLAEKDRDFPLYSRGKERFQFNYALYLLNRNIAQLRFAMGLQTTDLRATLPNLKSLLELKWGIRNNTSNMVYQAPRNHGHHDEQQQQQQRLPLIGNDAHPQQRVAPYPVQAPPVYSQVAPHQPPAQHDQPPPPYQQVEVGHDPPPSPYSDQNSPFEDLTPETEHSIPSAPIPIPSVDFAVKAIEAKQAMLIKHRDSEERTGQTTAVIETQVAHLSLEDPALGETHSETLQPRRESLEKDTSWPSLSSLEENNASPLKVLPLEVEQVQVAGQPGVSARSPAPVDQERTPESLHRIPRTSIEESQRDPLVLPAFPPSGQLVASEQDSAVGAAADAVPVALSSAANGKPVSQPSASSHHVAGIESSQPSVLPTRQPESIQSSSEVFAQDISPTPPGHPSPSGHPSNPHFGTGSHLSDDSSPHISSEQSNNSNIAEPASESLLSSGASSGKPSVAIAVPRSYEPGNYTHDVVEGVNQFDDLGSRAEALSRPDSFSSFRKAASSPTKARKSGKV